MPKNKDNDKEKKSPKEIREEEQLNSLREAFAQANSNENDVSELMSYIDSSDRARAYVVAQMLTNDIDKIKHITELTPQMISNLTIVGSTMAYMKEKGIDSSIRRNLYSEVLTLMVSNMRKGRGEIADILKAPQGENLMDRLKGKYAFLK